MWYLQNVSCSWINEKDWNKFWKSFAFCKVWRQGECHSAWLCRRYSSDTNKQCVIIQRHKIHTEWEAENNSHSDRNLGKHESPKWSRHKNNNPLTDVHHTDIQMHEHTHTHSWLQPNERMKVASCSVLWGNSSCIAPWSSHQYWSHMMTFDLSQGTFTTRTICMVSENNTHTYTDTL